MRDVRNVRKCPVVRNARNIRKCPVARNARKCPVARNARNMSGICPEMVDICCRFYSVRRSLYDANVILFSAHTARNARLPGMPGCPECPECPECPAAQRPTTHPTGGGDGPTVRLSRAAERALIERHGHGKEYMFVNRRWRRRLPALWGRDMAHDGPSGYPTVNTGGTPRSPSRAGDVTRRDPATGHTARDPAPGDTARDDHSRRRDRPQTIPHATGHTARDPATDPTGSNGPSGTARPATDDTARDDSLRIRICPEMPGICPEYA